MRYVLALSRAGTIAAAARALGVNDTTVLRRVKHLEQTLATPVFVRLRTGTVQPTATGSMILRHAERMEQEAAAIGEALGRSARKLVGTVRITSVPVIVNRVLVPALAPLLQRHPDLVVELIPDARDLNLTQREADLAIRLARPTQGGTKVKARRVGRLEYAIYAPAGRPEDTPQELGWITFEDMHAHLPQAQWVAKRGPAEARCGLRVADTETAMAAVADGLGKALLPTRIADADARLRRVDPPGAPDLPGRDVWLLSHAEQGGQSAVQTVISWIAGLSWSTAPAQDQAER